MPLKEWTAPRPRGRALLTCAPRARRRSSSRCPGRPRRTASAAPRPPGARGPPSPSPGPPAPRGEASAGTWLRSCACPRPPVLGRAPRPAGAPPPAVACSELREAVGGSVRPATPRLWGSGCSLRLPRLPGPFLEERRPGHAPRRR